MSKIIVARKPRGDPNAPETGKDIHLSVFERWEEVRAVAFLPNDVSPYAAIGSAIQVRTLLLDRAHLEGIRELARHS